MTGHVIVTGAAGFIGSHVCAALLEEGRDVVGIDNFDPFYSRSVKESALAPLRCHSRFRFLEGDVRSVRGWQRHVRGGAALVHLAARAGVRHSMRNPAAYRSINVDGTAAVLSVLRACGVRRLVFASSSSIYGDATLPFREAVSTGHPRSPYAATKWAGEQLCRRAVSGLGLRAVALRFFSVYGPGQRPDQAMHRFARQMVEGRALTRLGGGPSSRDYTYVGDVVSAVLQALRWTGDGPAQFEAINVGSGRPVALDHVVTLLGESLGIQPAITVGPAHPGDPRHTQADLAKAFRCLGYRPSVPVETGIPAFTQWFEVAYGRQSRAAS
ncbi:MAG TPA: NAD-dependent epimerase/dehydratase family protein [Gemmatimonadales bacterium]